MKNKIIYIIIGILIIGIIITGLLIIKGKRQNTSKDNEAEIFFKEEGNFIDWDKLPDDAIIQDLGDDKYHITF